MYRQVDWWNMKIHTINSYQNSGYHSHPSEHKVGLYENDMTQGYNVAFSGSRASIGEAATKGLKARFLNLFTNQTEKVSKYEKYVNMNDEEIFADLQKSHKYGEYGEYGKYDKDKLGTTLTEKILNSNIAQKAGDFFDNSPSIAQAFTALFIAGMLRPATNLAMADKNDREDSIYAASHAIASAIIGYAVSSVVLAPFDKAIKQITDDPETHLKGKEELLNVPKLGKRTLERAPRWAKVSQFLKMSFDTFILGIPKAMLTIALIPPILKYVFGMEKKPKNAKVLEMDGASMFAVNMDKFMESTKNSNKKPSNISFTGNPVAAAPQKLESKFFEPFHKFENKLVEFIRENYYKRLLDSKFMKWFVEKTDKIEQMTTHMMVAGSTLISGMYIMRTLQNDKLDKEKRKTLALNDCLTWGVSTFGSYAVDKSLNTWWEGQCRKFTALYIKKYTDPEYIAKFEAEEAKRKAKILAEGGEYKRPIFDPADLAAKCKTCGVTPENLNKRITESTDTIRVANIRFDIENKAALEWNKAHPEALKPIVEHLPEIKNVKDFNVEVLKFEPLSRKLKGLGALKSIFIFGMMYRYLVPVLVMKPANKIGAYIHQKNIEKQQAQQTQKA